MDQGDDWKSNCADQLDMLPVFDVNSVDWTGVSHEQDNDSFPSIPWAEPPGGLTCAPDH